MDKGEVPEEFHALVTKIEAGLRRKLKGFDVLVVHNIASLHKNLALTAAVYNLSQEVKSLRIILWHHDLAWTTKRYWDELHPGWPWDLLRTAWVGAKQVTISEARRQELATLLQIPLEDIIVVPAGLDMLDFYGLHTRTVALIEKLDLTMAAPILLTPVRITRRKNLELAISTLSELRREMPQGKLIITGPTGAHNPANKEYFKSLKKIRSKLGLKKAVYLMAEHVPHGLPDVCIADFFRLADALLLPSREEGFGIPILEAGLGRLPIFCSNLRPLQALAGEWATYFSPGDSPEYVASLIVKRLESDPIYKLRVRVRQEYTWKAIYQRQIAPLLEY